VPELLLYPELPWSLLLLLLLLVLQVLQDNSLFGQP